MKEILLDAFKHKVIEQEGLVFLAVQTDWCEPCKQMNDIVNELQSLLQDKKISFFSINLDNNPAFTAQYHMKGLPTVMLFLNGTLRVTIMGIKTVEEYKNIITQVFETKPSATDQHSIKVFSTPTCPYCHMAKAYLQEKNIMFEDIDVSRDQNKAMEMVNKSGQMGVPQLWIDDQVVVGFDKGRIDSILGL